MPLFRLSCASCGKSEQRLASSWGTLGLRPGALTCETCGGQLERAATGPSAQVMERLDNGAMARAVERPKDAQEQMEERAADADSLAGRSRRV